MNYYGKIIRPDLIDGERTGQIIRSSLSQLYEEGRFLGNFELATPHGRYIDTNHGDVASFQGHEWITVAREKVYELVYHGGVIKN